MPNVYLSPAFNEATLNSSGAPAVGWKLYTYIAGTSTPRATYTAQDGITQQANPIVLNARGEPDSPIWVLAGETKFILTTDADVPVRTVDDVTGVGTFGGGTVDVNGADIVNVDQIVGGTATAVTVGAFVPRWQNNGTSDATSSNGVGRFSGDATGPTSSFYKSRNAGIGSHTIVQSGDDLGSITFYGSNGTTFDPAVQILAEVATTPGTSSDMPGKLSFLVSPNASATPVAAMVIDHTGSVAIGTTTTALDLTLALANTDTATATSDTVISLSTGGASSGDPAITWSVAGVQGYWLGIDNSGSDVLQLQTNAAGPGTGNVAMQFNTGGNPLFPSHSTTANAANAVLDSGSGILQRSTSSLDYKSNVEQLGVEQALAAVNAVAEAAITYTSNIEKCPTDDPAIRYFGAGAENVAKIEPMLVNFDKSGRPIYTQYDRIGVPLAVLVRDIQRRLEAQGI